MGVLIDLRRYVTRPVIPFCFGVPLLFPATLLTVVAFLQDNISITLHILGILSLILSLMSIVFGIVLCSRDQCCKTTVHKRPTTVGFEKVKEKGKKGKGVKGKHCITPVTPVSISSPSSQNSSQRSSCSVGSISTHFTVTNEKNRLVPPKARVNRKQRNSRGNILAKKTSLMPAVKEEDYLSESGDMRHGMVRELSLQKLEKHLRQVGLGEVNRALAQSPVDVEMMPAPGKCHTDRTVSSKTRIHSRTKSLPESDFVNALDFVNDDLQEVVAGNSMEEEILRRSAKAARQETSQSQEPVLLTGQSHERTGIWTSMGSTVL